jgi:GNAT superfamily N-acetyltransferase
MQPTFTVIRRSSLTPEQKPLLESYYRLRKKAFEAGWGKTIYQAEANEYDLMPDTVFILMHEGERTIAGTRLFVHTPGDPKKLPCENTKGFLKLEKLLPHLDVTQKCYAELGGTVVDPEYKGQNLAQQLYERAYAEAKSLTCGTAQTPLEFLVTHANERILRSTLLAANNQGFHSLVRGDTRWHDRRLGSHPQMVFQSLDKDYPFLSDSMKIQRVGTEGMGYLKTLGQRSR